MRENYRVTGHSLIISMISVALCAHLKLDWYGCIAFAVMYISFTPFCLSEPGVIACCLYLPVQPVNTISVELIKILNQELIKILSYTKFTFSYQLIGH